MDAGALLSGPRISRVCIGRLHNLGNFEHVRYEVTVELPPGTAPSSVIGALDAMLDDISPKRPVTAWSLGSAIALLSRPALKWGKGAAPDAWISSDRPRAQLAALGIAQLQRKESRATPAAFRDLLLSIARSTHNDQLEPPKVGSKRQFGL